MENKFKYGTSLYRWGDIKECVDSLNVKLPSHLESKDENDPILFVVYPGKAKQVNVHTRFLFHKLVHILFFKDTLSLVADVYIVRQRAKPNRSIFL